MTVSFAQTRWCRRKRLVVMGIQDDAARMLVGALLKRHVGTRMAHGMNPSVSITDYPNAVVEFTLDHLGGLRTAFVFDGRSPVYLDYVADGCRR
ncbi:hypothetical protein [Mycolicibacterium wolinskyi]|nr:hypothetical protein [Mycolicibacterium wolinskyi]